ncbi:hypothetical protein M427DRAFT_362640 [Gonapodya prolifera JEL478]|uniref:Ankyrin n=1 Tax=Gonapodya prolifera (strain JEL478) TaxID=1344416 RepID=A0A139AAM3_GONPJ|nr:hypothetical protein M427DRAFT_362640 [Gonapodya prolifera JEL478]|eukprot:KXS13714.1 hypothetical protein M427DRAFT_362640 [Gonapodya prolifera JEL478]
MSLILNAQHIDAVEAGQEEDVNTLIEAGASPNARKSVTLKVKGANECGGFDWCKETVDCESALVLAIWGGKVNGVGRIFSNGKVGINMRGGAVTLNHPPTWARCEGLGRTPSQLLWSKSAEHAGTHRNCLRNNGHDLISRIRKA